MKTYLVLFSFFTLFINNCNNIKYASLEVCANSLSDITGNKLIMLSDSKCGYCQIAYKKLNNENFHNLKVVILGYNLNDNNKINEFTYINGNDCNEINKPNFFPQFFLFDSKNKLIWKKKGWFDDNIYKIKSKIDTEIF